MKTLRKFIVLAVLSTVVGFSITPAQAAPRQSTGTPPPPVSTDLKPAVSGL